MATTTQPCLKIDCCPPNDLAYSIVNGQVYTNPESSFVFDCPPGYVCQPGVYPKTVIIPEVHWQPPPHDPSKPQILSMPCCSGWIVETLPVGSTLADYNSAIAAMLAAFAQAEADCKDAQQPNRPAGFIVWNDQQSTSCLPEEGTLQVNWAGFPYNIYYDGVGLVMPPHVFGASTLTQPNAKASANAAAFAALMQVWNAAIASGQIECVLSPWTLFQPCVGDQSGIYPNCGTCDDPDLNTFTIGDNTLVFNVTHTCDLSDCPGPGWYWAAAYKQYGPFATDKILTFNVDWAITNGFYAAQWQNAFPNPVSQGCVDTDDWGLRDGIFPVIMQYCPLFGPFSTFLNDVASSGTDTLAHTLLAGNTVYGYVSVAINGGAVLPPSVVLDVTITITDPP